MIPARHQQALGDAQQAYNAVVNQIANEQSLGQSYFAPWTPARMRPGEHFSSMLGLPNAQSLINARIAYNPNPGSPRYYAYSGWGSYLGSIYNYFSSGYLGDSVFWHGAGYTAGYYGYHTPYSGSFGEYGGYWNGSNHISGWGIDFYYFAGSGSYGSSYWLLADLQFNVNVPNRRMSAPTLAIGQNQYNNWWLWGWGWNQTRMDALAGIEPNSEYLKKLVPTSSLYPTYLTSIGNSNQPTLPAKLEVPTLVDRGIRGELSNRLEGVTSHAADRVSSTKSTNPFLAEIADEPSDQDSGFLRKVYENDYIERQPNPDGTIHLYYVNAGWVWNAASVFIGTLDPVTSLVTIDENLQYLVPLAKVEAEVSGLGTTDDWTAWAKKNAVDPKTPTYFNLTFAHQPDRHNRVAAAQQEMEWLAKESVMHLAGAGFAIVPFRSFASFGTFKRAMGPAGEGMVWHHIVEQRTLNVARFGPEAIHNTRNVVKVSVEVNQRIANYYNSTTSFSQGMRVRHWLNSKSFEEQTRFGLDILDRVLHGRPLPL